MTTKGHRALQPEKRDQLLRDLNRLSTSSETDATIIRQFLPLPRHERALHPHTLVIRGERGAGKTALFRFLDGMKSQPAALARVFPNAHLPDGVAWVEGFSEAIAHPQAHVVDAFAGNATNEQLRVFWVAHLACALERGHPDLARLPPSVRDLWAKGAAPLDWVEAAFSHLADLSRYLDDAHRSLESSGRTVIVTYDYLDKVGLYSSGIRKRFAGALLALWFSLANRYPYLRPKIFVREDLFEASRTAFPDASKLEARSVSLDWDTESLYRVLIRHMAELSEALRDWLQTGQNAITLEQDDVLGWMPPTLPEAGRPSQKAFIDHLAGSQMGVGVKKGYTYRWIPNRLQDAHKRVVPRSLLNLIGKAADAALRNRQARHHQLVTPGDLMVALNETSKRRVEELSEEHPVVKRLGQLRGMNVLLPAATVRRRLAEQSKGEKGDGFADQGDAVMRELLRLGVLQQRSDGRIDVPDIYRYGFDIKRKGGVARPR